MSFCSWETCPVAVRTQVEQFIARIKTILTTDVVGVYLHGSLAMGCFNMARSDLDLLVVTYHPMTVCVKRQVAEHLLHLSQRPIPIEISFLAQAMLVPWHYPPVFDLHYSEMWRADYVRDLTSDSWRDWNTIQRRDPDVAAHITVLRQRGIALYGHPISTIFPAVPPADYVASISDDVVSALDGIADDPVYAILNACCTVAYLHTGRIYSKDEGGQWALDHFPAPLHPLVREARTQYSEETQAGQRFSSTLAPFREYMRHELQRLVSGPLAKC